MSEGRNLGGGEGAERDSALDRLYRAGMHEEPPAHLDAAILAAARREVGARPRPLSARTRAWRVPVSIAALVVLSVSLVTLVQEEGGEQLGQPSQHDLFALRNKAASADGAAPPPEAPAEPPAEHEARKALAAEKAPEPARRPNAASGATPPAATDDSARLRSAEQPSTPPPAGPAPQLFQGAPAAAERADPPAPVDPGVSADSATRSFGSRASISEELAASVAKPASKVPEQMRDSAPAGEMAGATASPPKVAAKPVERPRARAEARQQQKESLAPDLANASLGQLLKEIEAQPPEKWLAKIEALRREGRAADADEMLAEFKRRFPAHPLPGDSR
jgi:resuscitation-promoting factor RpfA